MTNIERNFVVKKIKKYEKLSDDQKNRATSSAFGLAYCLIAMVVGICNYETFISCFASHLKNPPKSRLVDQAAHK